MAVITVLQTTSILIPVNSKTEKQEKETNALTGWSELQGGRGIQNEAIF